MTRQGDAGFDLILAGGRVIDPANGRDAKLDVGVKDGKIAAVAAGLAGADTVVDCAGKIVTPGFLDVHTHFYASGHGGLASGDECGVKAGVTTVVDGGSAGYLTFPDFKARHLTGTVTDAYAYLHHNPLGQATLPETWDPKKIHVEYDRIRDTVAANRDVIVGLKDRAVGVFIHGAGIRGVERARQVCSDCGIRYGVHFGVDADDVIPDYELEVFTRELLRLMAPGDIVMHSCSGRRGRLFRRDGLYDREIRDAYERGVIFEASFGVTNFAADSFRIARERGFLPHTAATDISPWGVRETVKNFGVTLSKLLALGLGLPETVALVTSGAAQALGMADRKGSLSVGRQADISVSEVERGNYRFMDGRVGNETFSGEELLIPRLAIIAGRIHPTVNVGGPTIPEK